MEAPSVTAHGRTDVGRVRGGNEDALLLGTTVFAVADGMGGHRGGEVASATALGPLMMLDGRRFDDADAALDALTAAVVAANAAVSRRSQEDPALQGMGTTLTAVLVDGREALLAHVGDSRAYLARGERFVQLTDDHTLIRTLLDQGRITEDQVATHPHRSVITRAVGVAEDVDVDGMLLTLRDGDRLLLCSDGLTGVVDDATIARTLREHPPQDAVERLIDAANAAGGPDNITVVIIAADGGVDHDATFAIPKVVRIRTDEVDTDGLDWATRYSDLGGRDGSRRTGVRVAGPAARGGSRPRRSRERLLGGTFDRVALRLVVAVLAVALLGSGLTLGGRVVLDRAYLVGVAGEEVVIFRGFDVQLGPLDLKRVHERPGVLLTQVPPALRPVYEAGRPAADLGDARRIVAAIPLLDDGSATEADSGAGG